MPRPLVFRYGDDELAFQLNKIDRTKLYGSKDVEVLDDQERKCELATLADDGRTVVGKGGTGLGYVTVDGNWCEKKSLTPINLEGNEITPVKSSFDAPIELAERVSVEEYLNHKIRLVYLLEAEADIAAVRQELEDGVIFKFPYSYRGGLEADAAFLLAGADGNVFLAVGDPTQLRFVGLQQAAVVVEEEDTAGEDDLMDFDMI